MKTDNKALAHKSMVVSLVIAHIWGSILMWAVFEGRESTVIGNMFDTVAFMIFSTLLVLLGDKAWKDFLPLKMIEAGTVRKTEETTVQTTFEPKPDKEENVRD